VIQNYRLHDNVRRLWRFLAEHDVGKLTHATITYHTEPFAMEPVPWMREERANRVLLYDFAIHFVDIVVLLGGPLISIKSASTECTADGRATRRFSAEAEAKHGAQLYIELDATGVSRRTIVTLQFERATCELKFFPRTFRVLPASGNPIDDLASAARGLAGLVRQQFNRGSARGAAHAAIYALLALDSMEADSSFGPSGVVDTMHSLDMLGRHIYASHSGNGLLPGVKPDATKERQA
jgi:predicted dehydrogenase